MKCWPSATSNFRRSASARCRKCRKSGRTIVFVSHQMNQIRRLCERVIWIDGGEIRKDGPTLDVVSAYEGAFATRSNSDEAHLQGPGCGIQFVKWELVAEGGEPSNVLLHSGPFSFRVVVRLPEPIRKGIYAILLFDDTGRIIWHGNFELSALEAGTFEFLHRLPTLPIKPGAYRWKIGVYDGHEWADPWWAIPDLLVGTKPFLKTADEFLAILNLPCDMEIRTSEESSK